MASNVWCGSITTSLFQVYYITPTLDGSTFSNRSTFGAKQHLMMDIKSWLHVEIYTFTSFLMPLQARDHDFNVSGFCPVKLVYLNDNGCRMGCP